MSRFHANLNEHFCSNLVRIWQECRIINLTYGYIKFLVFEREYFPLNVIHNYLSALEAAVKDGSVLNYQKYLIELHPEHQPYKESLEHGKKCLDENRFFTYVTPPKVGMADDELIAIMYENPVFYGFDDDWEY